MGAAFDYLQLQGDSQFLLKGEGNPLFSSPEPDISEMCAGHPADTGRLALLSKRRARALRAFLLLVLREYIPLLMKDVEVRFRRTWVLESLRTSQGV